MLEENPDKLKKRPVRRAAPVSPGVGVRPVQQAGRGVPVRTAVQGSVPVRQDYLRSQASIGRVYSGSAAVRSVPQQSQVRRVAPVSPGVGVRPVPQVRRVVPVKMVVVRKPSSLPSGQAVVDDGLGIIPPVTNVSDSKISVFKNAFGGVRDKFEDVLDKLGGVFDSVRDRFEGAQGVTGFLVVHWWAILVVLGVIGILTFSGFVGISSLKQECTFSLSVDCLDHSVRKDSVEFLIKNVAERNIIVKNIKIRSDALEGSSGSGSGICELALDQRGRDLKKNQKYLFQLDVRPAVSLSAATPQYDASDWNLRAESVTLARAQGYNDPDLTATFASVSCAVNGSASDYLGRFGRNDPFRAPLDHYLGLVTDAVAKDPTPDSGSPVSRASTRATNKASEIRTVLSNLAFDINREASRLIIAGSTNTHQNVRNALRNAPDNFDSDSLQHKYAVMIRDDSQTQQTGDRIVQISRSAADELIAEVTAGLNKITAAARDESNRAFNPELIKQAAREAAERYAGRDSYFAADFVAKEIEKAGTIQQIRSKANSAYHHHIYQANYQNPRRSSGKLFEYDKIIFSYAAWPYYYKGLGGGKFLSISYSDYFDRFNKTDFTDGAHSSMGPVVDHYHGLVRDRVIPAYTRELENLENSAFYRGLSSSEKADLSRAFNDPYYDNNPISYGWLVTSPLDDFELNTRNDSLHLQANDILKDELYDRFRSIVPDVVTDARLAAGAVYEGTIRQIDDPVDAESVKNLAKQEAGGFGNTDSRHAGQFVSQRIERITSSDKDVVVSEIEAAVSDAIEAVTEGANYVADQARDANSGSSSGQFESQIKSYIRSKYPNSHAGYHAALFIANSDISGTDGPSVAGKVKSAGKKITNAVNLAVGNVSGDARYWSSRCPSGCSSYCYDANCYFEEYVLEFPNRCDDQCTDGSGSCSYDFECCSGSCESGACLDPNPVVCGSEGEVCCAGNSCNGNLVCSSGTCQAAVVCGSEGEVCCTGNSCDESLVCSSGTCQAAVVCGSEGEVCCTGNSCDESLVCSSGSCQVAVVCGSEGEVCCAGNSCSGDLVCSSGSCQVAVVCGSEGEVCCTIGAACVSGFECVSGTCQVSCGAEGQQCCTGGSQCTGDLVCANSGIATTCQQCGSGGQVCCSNRTCNENFECTGQGTGTCVGDCGSQGQECCSGDSECGTDLACVTSGDDRTCQSCGQNEQACCTTGDECRESGLECSEGTCVEAEECGSESQVCCAADTCGSDLECVSGTCVEAEECGSEGEVCCSRNRCDSDLECESGTCREIECGYEDQDCCSASTCASGFECMSGTCKEAEACGSEGLMCCRGGKCDSDLECVDNLCELPEEVVETVQYFSFGTLTPGLNTLLDVNASGIPFSSIQFTVSNEVSDARLNVTSRPGVPAGISGGPVGTQSYSYVTIASEGLSNENISSVSAKFSVDKTFFSGTSPSQIRVFEYNQEVSTWNKLDDPVHLSEDEENHYFSVVTGSLTGDFAIALENFVSCAHKDSAGGINRYSIELTYSWEASPAVNHKVVGMLSAGFS